MKDKNIFSVILEIIAIIFFLVGIYFALKILFGKTPSVLDMLIIIVSGLFIHMLKLSHDIGGFQGEFREFKRNAIESFLKIRKDIEKLGNSIEELKPKKRI